MKVVFLCGGSSTRMYPIEKDKFLMNFLGKTLIERQIDAAKETGLSEFIVIGNTKNIGKLKDALKHIKGIEFFSREGSKGMADTMLAIRAIKDDFIVVNPNDIFDSSAYKKILAEYNTSDYECYMVGYQVKDYFPGGYLSVNESNELKEIIEKPGKGNEPSNLVNIVIHLFRGRKLFEYLQKTKSDKDDVYERSIDRMVKDGIKVKVVRYDGFWKAVKYPWDLFQIMEYYFEKSEAGISKKAKISRKATIEGKVIIDDGAKILENAVIRGPCYIGKNTIIGNNSLIWNSHLTDNCVVGYGTEIKHSFIGNECWFHFNYVGDSVISDKCSFGAGTKLANLRFDEKTIAVNVKGEKIATKLDKFGSIFGEKCKCGINSSIMPGIKVGPNSIVGSSVCLTEDLERDKIIIVDKESYKISDNNIDFDTEKKKRQVQNFDLRWE